MNHEKFHGVYTALLTPYDDDGNIDCAALKKLIDSQIDDGINGFYADGTTSDAFMLTTEQRKEVIKASVDAVSGRVPVIAQVGSMSTDEAISLAKYAESVGADAISAVTPFYFSFTIREIKQYYRDIVSAVSIPLFIYMIPVRAGVVFTYEDLEDLLSDDRFIGLKYTSNDFYLLSRLTKRFPDKVFFNGFDEMFIAGLSVGAHGAIGSTYNLAPRVAAGIYRCWKAGQTDEARKYQQIMCDIIAGLFSVEYMPALRRALELKGFSMGKIHAPYLPVDEKRTEYIKKEILPLTE